MALDRLSLLGGYPIYGIPRNLFGQSMMKFVKV